MKSLIRNARYLAVFIVVGVVASSLGTLPADAAPDDPIPDCSFVVSATDIALTWTGVSGIDKYIAERSVNGGAWTWTGAPAAGTTSFSDNLPGNGGTVDGYRMFTKTNGVTSAATTCTDATGGGNTDPPVPDCAFIVGATDIALTWTGVSGIDKYIAERSVDGGAWTWTGAPAAGTTTFSDNLAAGGATTYGYQMFTKTNGVLSDATPCWEDDLDPPDDTDPAAVTACQFLPESTSSLTTWSLASTNADTIVVQHKPNGGVWTHVKNLDGEDRFYDTPIANADRVRVRTKFGVDKSPWLECDDAVYAGGLNGISPDLPQNIKTPQTPITAATDGQDLTATEFITTCVALLDGVPVVTSGTRFAGEIDHPSQTAWGTGAPFAGKNLLLGYVWVPEDWQIRAEGYVEITDGRRIIQGNIETQVDSQFHGHGIHTFTGPDEASIPTMDLSAVTWSDTFWGGSGWDPEVSTIPFDLAERQARGGRYMLIGFNFFGEATYEYDLTIVVEPRTDITNPGPGPFTPEPCRIWQDLDFVVNWAEIPMAVEMIAVAAAGEQITASLAFADCMRIANSSLKGEFGEISTLDVLGCGADIVGPGLDAAGDAFRVIRISDELDATIAQVRNIPASYFDEATEYVTTLRVLDDFPATGTTIWTKADGTPTAISVRGQWVEEIFGGNNLHPNFKTFDRFEIATGEAVSIKSLDLAAPSYQTESRVYSKLKKYIDEASEFDAANYQIVDSATGEVIKIDPAKLKTRTVKLAIPSGNWSAGQLNALKRAKEYGLSLDPPVQFEFHVIP